MQSSNNTITTNDDQHHGDQSGGMVDRRNINADPTSRSGVLLGTDPNVWGATTTLSTVGDDSSVESLKKQHQSKSSFCAMTEGAVVEIDEEQKPEEKAHRVSMDGSVVTFAIQQQEHGDQEDELKPERRESDQSSSTPDRRRSSAASSIVRRSVNAFRATLTYNRIRENKWLAISWGVFKILPPLLSLVGMALAIYALVDFAQYSQDYQQLQDQVDQQSRQDFDDIQTTFIELINTFLVLDEGTDTCQRPEQSQSLESFIHLLDFVRKLEDAPQRVFTSVLPSGTVWNDYFLEHFPALDSGVDYGNFANPSRFMIITLYGIPDMVPLFRVFFASLIFDILSVVMLVIPAIILWRRKETKPCSIALFAVDVVFFLASLALLLLTAFRASSTEGYSVASVKGQVSSFEGNLANEYSKEGINPEYWTPIPDEYCSDDLISCYPENSFQQGCSSARIDVTVPLDFLVQDGDRWYLDLDFAGATVQDKNVTRFLDFLHQKDELFNQYIEDNFGFAPPQEILDTVNNFKKGLVGSACPPDKQEFFWSADHLSEVAFPQESPDYDYVCNTQCQNDWSSPELTLTHFTDCPPGCTSAACGCVAADYSTCSTNCPGVDTADMCGCLAFTYGIWKYNCKSEIPVVTDENYKMFTSFALDNVRAGLAYDIAATVFDFVALCLIAISIFVPRVRKLLYKDQEVTQNSKRWDLKKSLAATLYRWKSPGAFSSSQPKCGPPSSSQLKSDTSGDCANIEDC